MLGVFVSFIFNAIKRKDQVKISIGYIKISFIHLQFHLKNINYFDKQKAIKIDDIFIKYKSIKQFDIITNEQFIQFCSQNPYSTQQLDITTPFQIIVSGIVIQLTTRPEISISKEQILSEQVKKCPLIFRLVPAINLIVNEITIQVGNKNIRSIVYINIPQIQSLISCVENKLGSYDIKVIFYLLKRQSRNIVVDLINNINIQKQLHVKNKNTIIHCPIMNSQSIRGCYTQTIVPCLQSEFLTNSDQDSPTQQLDIYFQNTSFAFMSVYMNELMEIIKYHFPDTYKKKGTLKNNSKLQLQIKALIINLMFLNQVPIILINKNKDFPEYVDKTDPFLNQLSESAGESEFLNQIEQEDLDANQTQVQNKFENILQNKLFNKNKQNKEKEQTHIQLITINYDDLCKKQEIHVPHMSQYFKSLQQLIIKLSAGTQVCIRNQSLFEPKETNLKQVGLKISLQTNQAQCYSSLSCNNICEAENICCLITNLYNDQNITIKPEQKITICCSSLRLLLMRQLIDQIINIASDYGEEYIIYEFYQQVGINIQPQRKPQQVSYNNKQVTILAANTDIYYNTVEQNVFQDSSYLDLTRINPTLLQKYYIEQKQQHLKQISINQYLQQLQKDNQQTNPKDKQITTIIRTTIEKITHQELINTYDSYCNILQYPGSDQLKFYSNDNKLPYPIFMSNSKKIVITIDTIRPQTNKQQKSKFNLFTGNILKIEGDGDVFIRGAHNSLLQQQVYDIYVATFQKFNLKLNMQHLNSDIPEKFNNLTLHFDKLNVLYIDQLINMIITLVFNLVMEQQKPININCFGEKQQILNCFNMKYLLDIHQKHKKYDKNIYMSSKNYNQSITEDTIAQTQSLIIHQLGNTSSNTSYSCSDEEGYTYSKSGRLTNFQFNLSFTNSQVIVSDQIDIQVTMFSEQGDIGNDIILQVPLITMNLSSIYQYLQFCLQIPLVQLSTQQSSRQQIQSLDKKLLLHCYFQDDKTQLLFKKKSCLQIQEFILEMNALQTYKQPIIQTLSRTLTIQVGSIQSQFTYEQFHIIMKVLYFVLQQQKFSLIDSPDIIEQQQNNDQDKKEELQPYESKCLLFFIFKLNQLQLNLQYDGQQFTIQTNQSISFTMNPGIKQLNGQQYNQIQQMSISNLQLFHQGKDSEGNICKKSDINIGFQIQYHSNNPQLYNKYDNLIKNQHYLNLEKQMVSYNSSISSQDQVQYDSFDFAIIPHQQVYQQLQVNLAQYFTVQSNDIDYQDQLLQALNSKNLDKQKRVLIQTQINQIQGNVCSQSILYIINLFNQLNVNGIQTLSDLIAIQLQTRQKVQIVKEQKDQTIYNQILQLDFFGFDLTLYQNQSSLKLLMQKFGIKFDVQLQEQMFDCNKVIFQTFYNKKAVREAKKQIIQRSRQKINSGSIQFTNLSIKKEDDQNIGINVKEMEFSLQNISDLQDMISIKIELQKSYIDSQYISTLLNLQIYQVINQMTQLIIKFKNNNTARKFINDYFYSQTQQQYDKLLKKSLEDQFLQNYVRDNYLEILRQTLIFKDQHHGQIRKQSKSLVEQSLSKINDVIEPQFEQIQKQEDKTYLILVKISQTQVDFIYKQEDDKQNITSSTAIINSLTFSGQYKNQEMYLKFRFGETQVQLFETAPQFTLQILQNVIPYEEKINTKNQENTVDDQMIQIIAQSDKQLKLGKQMLQLLYLFNIQALLELEKVTLTYSQKDLVSRTEIQNLKYNLSLYPGKYMAQVIHFLQFQSISSGIYLMSEKMLQLEINDCYVCSRSTEQEKFNNKIVTQTNIIFGNINLITKDIFDFYVEFVNSFKEFIQGIIIITSVKQKSEQKIRTTNINKFKENIPIVSVQLTINQIQIISTIMKIEYALFLDKLLVQVQNINQEVNLLKSLISYKQLCLQIQQDKILFPVLNLYLNICLIKQNTNVKVYLQKQNTQLSFQNFINVYLTYNNILQCAYKIREMFNEEKETQIQLKQQNIDTQKKQQQYLQNITIQIDTEPIGLYINMDEYLLKLGLDQIQLNIQLHKFDSQFKINVPKIYLLCSDVDQNDIQLKDLIFNEGTQTIQIYKADQVINVLLYFVAQISADTTQQEQYQQCNFFIQDVQVITCPNMLSFISKIYQNFDCIYTAKQKSQIQAIKFSLFKNQQNDLDQVLLSIPGKIIYKADINQLTIGLMYNDKNIIELCCKDIFINDEYLNITQQEQNKVQDKIQLSAQYFELQSYTYELQGNNIIKQNVSYFSTSAIVMLNIQYKEIQLIDTNIDINTTQCKIYQEIGYQILYLLHRIKQFTQKKQNIQQNIQQHVQEDQDLQIGIQIVNHKPKDIKLQFITQEFKIELCEQVQSSYISVPSLQFLINMKCYDLQFNDEQLIINECKQCCYDLDMKYARVEVPQHMEIGIKFSLQKILEDVSLSQIQFIYKIFEQGSLINKIDEYQTLQTIDSVSEDFSTSINLIIDKYLQQQFYLRAEILVEQFLIVLSNRFNYNSYDIDEDMLYIYLNKIQASFQQKQQSKLDINFKLNQIKAYLTSQQYQDQINYAQNQCDNQFAEYQIYNSFINISKIQFNCLQTSKQLTLQLDRILAYQNINLIQWYTQLIQEIIYIIQYDGKQKQNKKISIIHITKQDKFNKITFSLQNLTVVLNNDNYYNLSQLKYQGPITPQVEKQILIFKFLQREKIQQELNSLLQLETIGQLKYNYIYEHKNKTFNQQLNLPQISLSEQIDQIYKINLDPILIQNQINYIEGIRNFEGQIIIPKITAQQIAKDNNQQDINIQLDDLSINLQYYLNLQMRIQLKSINGLVSLTPIYSLTKLNIQLLSYLSLDNQAKNSQQGVIEQQINYQLLQSSIMTMKKQTKQTSKISTESQQLKSQVTIQQQKNLDTSQKLAQAMQTSQDSDLVIELEQIDVKFARFTGNDENKLWLQSNKLKVNLFQDIEGQKLFTQPLKYIEYEKIKSFNNKRLGNIVNQRYQFGILQLLLQVVDNQQKQNSKGISILNANYIFELQSQIQLINSYLYYLVKLQGKKEPGQIQTGNQMQQILNIVNGSINDIIQFIQTIKSQKSNLQNSNRFEKQQKIKENKHKIINQCHIVNYKEIDKQPILLKTQQVNLEKMLPTIDMLGQGTGIVESGLRNFTKTTQLLENMLVDLNQYLLYLFYFIQQKIN